MAFKDNLKVIENINSKNMTWTAGINQFTDMTPQEFKAYVALSGGFKESDRPKNYVKLDTKNLETSIDWVSRGAVTPVKDQGQCGSCWAFSTTGGLEGAYEQTHGTLESFSEQELVDCDSVDSGCGGGLMDYGYQFAQQEGGLCRESDHQYDAADESCKKYNCSPVSFSITAINDVYQDTTGSQLKSALNNGPVSVAIEADQTVFQYYNGGVLTSTSCGTNLDHGVLAVGYGTDNYQEYFKVKNSWGGSWGESGYIRMGTNNICGICQMPSYPTMSD